MTTITYTFLGILVSLYFLVWSSNRFVSSSVRLGEFYKLPKFLIGILFLSVGTSLPELVTSVIATLNGVYDISVGNALGSNITNIFLILALLGIIGRNVEIKKVKVESLLMFLVSSVFLVILGYKGVISLYGALILTSLYGVYISYVFYDHYRIKKIPEFVEEKGRPVKPLLEWFLFAISSIILYFSAKYTIYFVVDLSHYLNVSSSVIASTLVALGTSLPELMVTYSALKMKEIDLIIGDLIGSNIFNALMVVGIPAIFASQEVSLVLRNYGFPMLIAATLIMMSYIKQKSVKFVDGVLMLIMYVMYLVLVV